MQNIILSALVRGCYLAGRATSSRLIGRFGPVVGLLLHVALWLGTPALILWALVGQS